MTGQLIEHVATSVAALPLAIDAAGLIVGIVGVVVGVLGSAVGVLYARGHRRDITQARREIAKAGVDIEKARKHIVKLRRQTLSALGLHEVVVTDPELELGVRKIATQYARVSDEDNNDPLLQDLTRHKLYDTAQFMNMASDAHITWGADSLTHAERLASTLLGVTLPEDHFWASSVVGTAFWHRATAYLKQQQESAKEGVIVSRVFIFDSDNPYGAEAIEQMQRQKDAGIHVTFITEPKFLAQDLVVVLRPIEPGSKELLPIYAMECRLGQDKYVDHVDLWASQGVQSRVVEKIWWSLHGIFSLAPPLDPPLDDTYPRPGLPSRDLPRRPETDG